MFVPIAISLGLIKSTIPKTVGPLLYAGVMSVGFVPECNLICAVLMVPH